MPTGAERKQRAKRRFHARYSPRSSDEVRTTRCSGFAHVRNSVRAAPLLSTASLTNPLYACANGAKRHLVGEHGSAAVAFAHLCR